MNEQKMKSFCLKDFMYRLYDNNCKIKAVTKIHYLTLPDSSSDAKVRYIRKYFEQWRHTDQLIKQEKYQNSEGQKRLEILSHEQELHNIVDLAIVQGGYQPNEISKSLYLEESKQNQSQLKAAIQLRQVVTSNHKALLSKCVQQWKQFTKHRKLYKYWLSHLEMLQTKDEEKLSLYRAFRMWKFNFLDQQKLLEKRAYSELQDLNILTSKAIDE